MTISCLLLRQAQFSHLPSVEYRSFIITQMIQLYSMAPYIPYTFHDETLWWKVPGGPVFYRPQGSHRVVASSAQHWTAEIFACEDDPTMQTDAMRDRDLVGSVYALKSSWLKPSSESVRPTSSGYIDHHPAPSGANVLWSAWKNGSRCQSRQSSTASAYIYSRLDLVLPLDSDVH